MANQGTVSFPGVSQVVSASYTLQHGITPGIASVETVPQAGFAGTGGTLTFTYTRDTGGPITISLPNCKIARAEFSIGPQGRIWRLQILDRRWKWAFPTISGFYNRRNEKGQVMDETGVPVRQTKKNARELATLLLTALNETGFDVAALPTTSYPTVEWDAENAAQALAQLADDHGCRVVLGLDNAVHIYKLNVGAALPLLPEAIDYSGSIDPPEVPDKIGVACAHVRHQCDLVLEAVGENDDGKVLPIDQLSYKPAGGWELSDPPEFNAIADLKQRELAKRSVFRWYRILVPFRIFTIDASNNIATRTISHLDEILPLETDMVDTLLDGSTEREREAIAYGVYHDGTDGATPQQSQLLPIANYTDAYAKKATIQSGFSLDADLGIVKFSRQVFKWKTLAAGGFEYKPQPADLALRTAFPVRDLTTRAFKRYLFERSLGTNYNTGTAIVKRDDLVPTLITKYAAGQQLLPNALPASSTDNFTSLNTDAQQALDGIEVQYQTEFPESALYAGLIAQSPDGAIQQVTWSVGPGGTTTRIARNKEVAGVSSLYAVRRMYERQRGQKAPAVLSGKVVRRLLKRS